jgi:hypothetical protein
MKIAQDIAKVVEVIEGKFSAEELKKAKDKFKVNAQKYKIPYITYLRIISQSKELSATGRLLAMYLLYKLI